MAMILELQFQNDKFIILHTPFQCSMYTFLMLCFPVGIFYIFIDFILFVWIHYCMIPFTIDCSILHLIIPNIWSCLVEQIISMLLWYYAFGKHVAVPMYCNTCVCYLPFSAGYVSLRVAWVYALILKVGVILDSWMILGPWMPFQVIIGAEIKVTEWSSWK